MADTIELIKGAVPARGFVRATAGRLRMAQHAQTQERLGRESAPLGQRGGAPLFVDLAGDEMALLIEMVVDLGMN
jgi:hypothetical protein